MNTSFYNGVVKTSTFRDFADRHFETVLIDLRPRSDTDMSVDERRNCEAFLKEWNVVAFPTVLILDSKGYEVNRYFGYDRKGASIFVRNLSNALGLDS